MRPELDMKLVRSFPKIFRDRHESPTKTAMCWGFMCGDGWYALIYTLCSLIQEYIDKNNLSQVVAVEVKEKYGGLRFYTDYEDDVIGSYIWFAEEMSCRICEVCGTTVNVKQRLLGRWIYTRCNKCWQKETRRKKSKNSCLNSKSKKRSKK
ncbi:MAG TPA: hypothetical protein P5140_05690 [Methanofastidiosum sp.]|nr:hypothetical protein [Methanofastidiosum sp.]